MKTPRDFFLTIGKKNYSVRSALDNEEIDRVKDLIDQACGNLTETDQENLLMLTCLRLAYSLDHLGGKVEDVIKRIDKSN